MIDIQLFSGPNFTEPFFSQFQITLVDEWGREVISLLDFKYFIVTSTLTVGHIKRFNLHVNESYEGCIKAKEKPMNFLSGSLLKQFLVKLPMTSSQICYVDADPAGSSQAERTCCTVIENYGSNCQCDEDQYQRKKFSFFSLPHVRTCLVLGNFLFIFIFYFILSTEHDEHQSQEALSTYYRLNENTMSIRYYVRFILWEDRGKRVSMIRRFVLVTFCLGVYCWHIQPLLPQNWLVALKIVFGIWSLLVYVCPSTAAFSASPYEHRYHTPKWLVPILQLLKYPHGICQGYYIECVSVKKLICLPFNINSWREMSETLERKVTEKISEFFQKISIKYFEKIGDFTSIKNIFDYCCRLIAPPFYLLFLGLVFITMICLTIVTLLAKPCVLLKNLKCKRRNTAAIILFQIKLITSSLIVSIIMSLTCLPFLLGLLCNITYFIPYITVILVSFHYLVQFWKSFNNKYIALKMFIHKEYQEKKLKEKVKELELTVANKELETAKAKEKIAKDEKQKALENQEAAKRTAHGLVVARNGENATGNRKDCIEGRNREEKSLLTAIEKLDKTKQDLVIANDKYLKEIKTVADKNATLAKANMKLATANVKFAEANVKFAEANVKLGNVSKESADAEKAHEEHAKKKVTTDKDEVKTVKNEVNTAKNEVKTAKDEVNTAKDEVNTAEDEVKRVINEIDNPEIDNPETRVKKPKAADVKSTQNSVKRAKKEVQKHMKKVDENIKKEKKLFQDVERNIPDKKNTDSWEERIEEWRKNTDLIQCESMSKDLSEKRKLCATVNDLHTNVRATANDQLFIANILHLPLSQKGHIVPVISKNIYHQIQERILPYGANFFSLVIKSLLFVLFTFFCTQFVKGRQESNFIDIVKVLTTISVSVLPYFFNVLFLTLNEHEKEAWNEMIKVNVKHIVDELDNDRELSNTIFILQRHICSAEKIEKSDEGNQGAQDD